MNAPLRSLLVLLVLSVLSGATLTQAQTSDMDRALVLFERAEERYRAEEYEAAAVLLREAVSLYDEAPAIHYNLAKVLDQLDEPQGAIDAYRRFLQLAPDHPSRSEVELKIAELELAVAAPEVAPEVSEPADAEVDPIVEPAGDGVNPVPWILLGAAAAPLALGIVGGVKSSNSVSSARDAASQVDAAPHRDDAKKFATMANVGFGIAGALALAGLIWGIIDLTGDSDGDEGQARLRIGAGAIAVEGTF